MGQQEAIEHSENGFHHSTLFYAGEDAFLEGALPFLEGGLAAEEPILVAVAGARIELLQRALSSSDAERVHFADMHVLGSNPARIIPAWRRFLAEHALDGRPVRGIGEPIWAGRSDAELSECHRHESLLNVAFHGGQAWQLLCPYDLDALDGEIIEAAQRSHPFITREGFTYSNDAYLQLHEAPGPFDGTLPAPSTQPQELSFTGNDLSRLRWFVSRGAARALLPPDRVEDLVLAANELATNSVRHGGGSGTVRIWAEADTLLCEVQDGGHIVEPLVGRNPPAPTQATGRGLWIAHHLCDLVQIRSSPEGSLVRLHMRLA